MRERGRLVVASLRELQQASDVKIIFCPSYEMQFYLQGKIHEILRNHKDTRIYAKTDKEIRDAYNQMTNPPFEGDYWVTHIEFNSKVTPRMLDNYVYTKSHDYGVFILWVMEYRDLFKVQTKIFQKNYKDVIPFLNFGKLEINDMYEFMQLQVPEEFRLSKLLEEFVVDNYSWDVKAFTALISNLQGGMTFNTETDIIRAIGLGRKSVDQLTMKLLTTTTSTKAGVKRLYAESLFFIENLHAEHEYNTIVNFFYASVKSVYELKLYQLNGFQGAGLEEIPTKAKRIRRYSRSIEQKVLLVDILNLLTAIDMHRGRDGKITLVMALSTYLDYLYTRGGGDAGEAERQRLAKEKRERKKKEKEEREAMKERQERKVAT